MEDVTKEQIADAAIAFARLEIEANRQTLAHGDYPESLSRQLEDAEWRLDDLVNAWLAAHV